MKPRWDSATGGLIVSPDDRCRRGTARLAHFDVKRRQVFPVAGQLRKLVFDGGSCTLWMRAQPAAGSENPLSAIQLGNNIAGGSLPSLSSSAQATALAWMYRARRRCSLRSELRQRLQVIHLNRTAVAARCRLIAHDSTSRWASNYAEAPSLSSSRPAQYRAQRILQHPAGRSARLRHHQSLRGLLKKGCRVAGLDLNEVIQDALQIIRSEALKRGMALDAAMPTVPCRCAATRVHLQQSS